VKCRLPLLWLEPFAASLIAAYASALVIWGGASWFGDLGQLVLLSGSMFTIAVWRFVQVERT